MIEYLKPNQNHSTSYSAVTLNKLLQLSKIKTVRLVIPISQGCSTIKIEKVTIKSFDLLL